MGNCNGGNIPTNNQLNAFVRESVDEYHEEIKLLILGPGDSGKSTFMKQCKICLMDGFSRNEILGYVLALRSNTMFSMKNLISLGRKREIEFSHKLKKRMKRVRESESLDEVCAQSITYIWRDDEFREFYHEFKHLSGTPSSAPYFFENAVRFSETFKPTNEDIVRCKLKTTGIFEVKVQHKHRNYLLVDVGGQRAERRKWLHCFDNVNTIIFLIPTDGYNMTIEEDGQTNRITEAVELLRNVSSSTHLCNLQFLLLFNKTDLFREKLKKHPLSNFYEDISESADYEESLAFVQNKFLENFEGNLEPIVIETCALEKDICETIFTHFKTTPTI